MRAESPLTSPAATRDAKEEAECEDSAATGELTAAGGHRWLPGSDETRQRICFVHAFRLLFLHSFNGVTETGTPAGEDVPRPQQLLRLNFHYNFHYTVVLATCVLASGCKCFLHEGCCWRPSDAA